MRYPALAALLLCPALLLTPGAFANDETDPDSKASAQELHDADAENAPVEDGRSTSGTTPLHSDVVSPLVPELKTQFLPSGRQTISPTGEYVPFHLSGDGLLPQNALTLGDGTPGGDIHSLLHATRALESHVPKEKRLTLQTLGMTFSAFIKNDKLSSAPEPEAETDARATEVRAQLVRDTPQIIEVVDSIPTRVLEKEPVVQRAVTVYADQLARVADTPEASQAVRRIAARVVEVAPEDPAARNVRATAAFGMGDYEAARKDADYILERDKNNQRAYTTRALAAYQEQDYAQALEDAKRALALNKNNKVAHQVLKLSQGRVTTADELGLDTVSRAAAERIGAEYEAHERQRSQVESIIAQAPKKAVAHKDNDFADSLNQKALAKIQLNDPQGALKLTNRVLDKQPDNVNALYARAVAENLMGNYPHAVEDATQVLHFDPQHANALDARAQALNNLKRFNEAAMDADASLAINPKNPYAYVNRAKAKEQLGDIAGMIADYKSAARLSPQFSDELRAIARKYNLPLETAGATSGRVTGLRTAEARSKTNSRFSVILVSSLSGGLLIAFGLMQIMRPRQPGGNALPNASPETKAALAGIGLQGYEQIRVLGQGGMGVVFEAHDKALDRTVAIKKMRDEIHLNESERKHFLQEARLVAKLAHPNIVSIHNIIEENDELYMIFEHVKGKTLDELLAKRGKLKPKECAFVMRGICHALAYAHSKGVIHRDLKPANIMITDEGMIKVMDFGIARQAADAKSAKTHTRTVAGTPQYMAPEQDQGEVRKESDIFALTACFYEILTGRRPFPNPTTTASKLNKQYERPSRVTTGLPAELDTFIDAGLEPDPGKRIKSAQDFLARLDALNLPSTLRT
jgi:tetratricopeptide (TPR) repeat protein